MMARKKNFWMRFRTDTSGSMQVDFALSISLVMMVTFGIMDLCRAVYVDHFVANAARSATRYAIVRGASWNGAPCLTPTAYGCEATKTDTRSYVQSIVPLGFDTSDLTVHTSWPGVGPTGMACDTSQGVNNAGCIVSVRVDYSFRFVLPFLPTNVLDLTSTSNLTIVQ
jgi:Flp pilus assembly protein TadG